MEYPYDDDLPPHLPPDPAVFRPHQSSSEVVILPTSRPRQQSSRSRPSSVISDSSRHAGSYWSRNSGPSFPPPPIPPNYSTSSMSSAPVVIERKRSSSRSSRLVGDIALPSVRPVQPLSPVALRSPDRFDSPVRVRSRSRSRRHRNRYGLDDSDDDEEFCYRDHDRDYLRYRERERDFSRPRRWSTRDSEDWNRPPLPSMDERLREREEQDRLEREIRLEMEEKSLEERLMLKEFKLAEAQAKQIELRDQDTLEPLQHHDGTLPAGCWRCCKCSSINVLDNASGVCPICGHEKEKLKSDSEAEEMKTSKSKIQELGVETRINTGGESTERQNTRFDNVSGQQTSTGETSRTGENRRVEIQLTSSAQSPKQQNDQDQLEREVEYLRQDMARLKARRAALEAEAEAETIIIGNHERDRLRRIGERDVEERRIMEELRSREILREAAQIEKEREIKRKIEAEKEQKRLEAEVAGIRKADKLFEKKVKQKFLAAGYSEEDAERILSGKKTSRSNPKPSAEQSDENKKTYVKVHRKYILPETLDAFHLPWEWDEGDGSYIVIKKWIDKDLQDELFEHTRKIKERKPTVREDPVEQKDDTLFIVRKKAPARRPGIFN